jgi:hypothetical protein
VRSLRHESGDLRCEVQSPRLVGAWRFELKTVRAEGMNIPPLADSALPNTERAVETLAL